ncbi:sulfite exporter TauE/SafE family protein [Brevibacterium album]|uniref:sulfite exporter TauE/SafE family protein n=1 Tax=Brevibacterium album TaxID=417948 RepID=UPI0003FE0EA4|nr:sulfite exporter TauE/SafE family protein [Brevibacterium album]
MPLSLLALVVAAVLVGATLQRLSGTGVGLVVAPVLALAMGPSLGVFVTNATTVVSGFLIMLSVLRDVDWRRWLVFAPMAVVGGVPAALLVRELEDGWLNIVIGAVVLLALAMTFGLPRVPHVRGRALPPVTAATGAVGGFLNTAAGVAAPAMVIYSKLSRWEQRRFAATMQPTFMTMGLVSVGAKLSVGATTLSQLPPLWLFPVIVVTVAGGIAAGGWLARRVRASTARTVAITLAGAGAAVALTRGLLTVLG